MHDTNSQSRRKYRSAMVRATDEKLPSFRPGPRDPEILRFVNDFRFLTSKHIVALSGGYRTNIEKRLSKLFHHGYLDRRWDAGEKPWERGPAIYQLARPGVELLAQVSGRDPAEFEITLKRNQVKQPFLQHALMISQIRTVFTLATRARPEYSLKFWRQDKELKDHVKVGDDPIYKGIQSEAWPIVPDSFFGLEQQGGRPFYCMLEADRSTMSHQDMLRKYRSYFLWWQQGLHTKKFDIPHFIVLTVTLTAERAKNLLELCRKVDDREKGCRLFWFTTLEQLPLNQPEHVFDDIWAMWDNRRAIKGSLK